jgi:hypothetical protein
MSIVGIRGLLGTTVEVLDTWDVMVVPVRLEVLELCHERVDLDNEGIVVDNEWLGSHNSGSEMHTTYPDGLSYVASPSREPWQRSQWPLYHKAARQVTSVSQCSMQEP